MIDVASAGDWMQGLAMVGVVGGVAAAGVRAFREEPVTAVARRRRIAVTVAVDGRPRGQRARTERGWSELGTAR